MEDKNMSEQTEDKQGFKGYAVRRIALGVLLTFAGLWIFGTVLGGFTASDTQHAAKTNDSRAAETAHVSADAGHGPAQPASDEGHGAKTAAAPKTHAEPAPHGDAGHQPPEGTGHAKAEGHTGSAPAAHGDTAEPVAGLRKPEVAETHATAAAGHGTAPAAAHGDTAEPVAGLRKPDVGETHATAATGHGAVPAGDPGHTSRNARGRSWAGQGGPRRPMAAPAKGPGTPAATGRVNRAPGTRPLTRTCPKGWRSSTRSSIPWITS